MSRLGIAGVAVALLTACPEDAADIVEIKAVSLDFDVAPTPASFPSGTMAIEGTGGVGGAPDSVAVELFNMEALDGSARWQVWLMNRREAPVTMTPAVGTYQRVAILRDRDPVTGELLSEEDSVLETVTETAVFAGQLSQDIPDEPNRDDPAEVKHLLVVTDGTLAGSTLAEFSDVVVTMEAGGAAMMPSNAAALWFQYLEGDGTQNSGDLLFGNFVASDTLDSRVVTDADFAQTSGFGGVRDGEQVSVDIRNLPRPPIGFFFQGWLVGPTSQTLDMGPLTTLPPDTVSLLNADVDEGLPSVSSTGIRFANASVEYDFGTVISQSVTAEDTTFTINLNQFFVTLEPKLGVIGTKNVADVQAGGLPTETLITRRLSDLRGQ